MNTELLVSETADVVICLHHIFKPGKWIEYVASLRKSLVEYMESDEERTRPIDDSKTFDEGEN